MDPSQAAFEELERVLGSARFTFEHPHEQRAGSREITNIEPIYIPTVIGETLDSDDENGPGPFNHTHDIGSVSPQGDDTRSITLPPTPPIRELPKSSQLRSLFLRAGFGPDDLRSQPSGLSSGGVDWHSLPTPDPSPPRTRENLLLPFHLLDHSPSSYADSFRTAREGQSRADSPSSGRSASPGGAGPRFQDMSKETDLGPDGPSDRSQSPVSSSGDNLDYSRSTFEPPHRRSVSESASSPLKPSDLERSSSQSTAQRRLWSIIQPGDAIKRPDQALLYATHARSVVQNRPAILPGGIEHALPDTYAVDVTHTSNDLALNDGARSGIMIQPTSDEEIYQVDDQEAKGSALSVSDKTHSNDGTSEPPGAEAVCEKENVVREDDPGPAEKQNTHELMSAPPPEPEDLQPIKDHVRHFSMNDVAARPRTPHSATKSSLEDNNVVYKLIREENVKRHSNISDGSVQAVVVALPEHKRTLRHTPKRHSLRGDTSLTSNSHRSSAESGPKSIKRNTGTTFTTASETDLTSPDFSPSVAKAALRTASTSQLPSDPPGDSQSPKNDRRSPRGASSGSNTVIPARRSSGSQSTQHHSLRRSTRDRSLDHTGVVVHDDSDELDETPRVGSPPMHQAAHMSSKPVYVPLTSLYPSPRLRRSSNESRLERNANTKHADPDRTRGRTSQPLEVKLEQAAQELTREGQELPDDRFSLALASTVASPKRGSLDVHSHHPTHASFSVSQASMPTDVELLEARGVTFYPHHNESVLVVQQGPRTNVDKDDLDRPSTSGADGAAREGVSELNVTARPRATSVDGIGRPKYAVDSPLTNPRAPPEPPMIKFIPPTPSEELEAELVLPREQEATTSANIPQRRPSLSQRVRRYSEGLVQPLGFRRLGSLRKQRQQQQQEQSQPPQRQRASTVSDGQRPTHLSSFWHPRAFWADIDDNDSLTDGDEDEMLLDANDPVIASLPYPRQQEQQQQKTPARPPPHFPRNMSVRMPGFRGTGGFLLGNSLGIDRHGTNTRRHYVRWPSSEEQRKARVAARKREVELGLGQRQGRRQPGGGQQLEPRPGSPPALKQPSSDQQLRVDRHPTGLAEHTFELPSSRRRSDSSEGGDFGGLGRYQLRAGGTTVQYVGLRGLRKHWKAVRARKEVEALERRREALRSRIGTRVYHDGKYGTS